MARIGFSLRAPLFKRGRDWTLVFITEVGILRSESKSDLTLAEGREIQCSSQGLLAVDLSHFIPLWSGGDLTEVGGGARELYVPSQ